MKTIQLGFTVPDDTETTSENLRRMRDILLSALTYAVNENATGYWSGDPVTLENDSNLIIALLTES